MDTILSLLFPLLHVTIEFAALGFLLFSLYAHKFSSVFHAILDILRLSTYVNFRLLISGGCKRAAWGRDRLSREIALPINFRRKPDARPCASFQIGHGKAQLRIQEKKLPNDNLY